MNIPKVILNDRKIISSEVYHYYQSLAQQLIKNQRNSNINIKKNYSKEKILNWFSNLNIKQKFKICSIYNNWFSNIIYQMLEYSRFDSVIEFCPTDIYLEFKKNNLYEYNYLKTELSSTDKIKNYDNFITFFIGENKVKKSIGIPDETELININLKNHYENLFFAYLRFITLDELNDTISFSYDLFEHPERLFEFFNFFSKEQCFTSVINPILEKNNCYNFSFPNWVYNYQSYSFCQLLIIFFEQIISVYYQLYLYAKEIPQLSIDNKFTNFFKTNENIKEYLSNKIKNKNDIIINREECFDKINNKINSDKYSYYENKSAFVYSIAFGPSFFEKNINKKREFNLRFNYLMEFIQKDVNGFIEKISFIEAKECFKYTNFIYYVIYQQLIKQCSDSCYQELLSEEKNKTQNESGTNKTKKNKRRKKKKKKTENDNNKEIENTNNINIITDEYNEEESKKNIIEEGEEEIEEIPADYIIHPKTEQNLKESESNNNNIINSNDINNSTVSSSYTNKYSKDNNYNFGPKYNNFFKCEKKETEMLLEIKDFTDDKSEDSNEENEKNNKIELEDISENDISEENNNNEYNNNSTLNESENKKKKKKHKKRNKKKKNKMNDEIDNDIINKNQIKNDIILKEKNEIININNIINSKKIQIESNIKINNKNNEINNINIKKDILEINNSFKDKVDKEKKINNDLVQEEIKEQKQNKNDNIEKLKIEENIKENSKNKKKNEKEFFLFPVNKSNKKKDKATNTNQKDKKNSSNIIIDIKDEKNSSINNKNISNEEKNVPNKITQEKPKNEEINNKEENIISMNSFEINQKSQNSNIKNNNIDKNKIEHQTLKESELLKKNDKSNNINESKLVNNIYFLNQSAYFNPIFYNNCNNSFFIFQNDLFTILGKDILKFQKIVENNLIEINIYREKVINKLKQFILANLSSKYYIKFLFYGSHSTGLSIESSDIDILIKFQKKNIDEKYQINSQQNIQDLIFQLNEDFKKNITELNIDKINPIYTASIPVLKIECLLKDIIPVDIQNKLSEKYLFNFENELLKLNFDFTFLEVADINKEQIIPSKEIINYIKDTINIYPNIKPIILVLKRYMQIKKLNSSYHGGLSSFSLFLLVASYNKHIFNENKYLDKNKDFNNLLGQIFYGFFMFYASFNFNINSIDLKKINPIILLNEFSESKITLIDPITGLNAAKSTFKIEQIKYTFNNAIMAINDIFFKNMNYIDNDEQSNIITKLLTSNNYTNYFY